MRHRVRIRGRGSVLISAYGVADAEHQVEKELARLWPEAAVVIDEISRVGPTRIVEEFRVRYRISGLIDVETERPADAAPEAFRALQSRIGGTRYARTVWERE